MNQKDSQNGQPTGHPHPYPPQPEYQAQPPQYEYPAEAAYPGYEAQPASYEYPAQPIYPEYPAQPTYVYPAQPEDDQNVPDINQKFGLNPVSAYCAHCKKRVVTSTTESLGLMTCILSITICLLGAFCCCCCLGLIPCYIRECKKVEHRCPRCGNNLGVNRPC